MHLFDEWRSALPKLDLSVPFDLEPATPAVFRVGSHSHGTYVPPEHKFGIDDVDMMVICVPPAPYKLGLRDWSHGEYKHGHLDVVFYEWGKWLRMLLKSNPNVLGTLWLENEDVLIGGVSANGFTSFGPLLRLLRERTKLLSKDMYPAFIGYAKGQLHKMTHFAHEGYMGDKRKRLVAEFGYDVKNAAHMIRLLRMACEAFEHGVLTVRRHSDAQELIDIKQGKWTMEQVVAESEQLFARAEGAVAKSSLPDHPDELFVQRVMLAGYEEAWGWKRT